MNQPADADTAEVAVSVAVITFESSAVLPEFFASLPAGLEGVDTSEVVVVDNASTDGTLDVAARLWPSARLVQLGANRGYAAGINAATAVSRGRTILACNADLRFRPGCVRRLLEALGTPGTGIAVAREMKSTGVRDDSLRREPTLRTAFGDALVGGITAGRLGIGEAVRGEEHYRSTRTADWASGAAQLISRECLRATGPWDESFFLYSEETDFHLRARDVGYRLRYVPDAVIDHDGGDMTTSEPLWSLRAVNRAVLYRRRHGAVSSWAFWAAVTLNEALRMRRAPVHRAATRALLRYARTGDRPKVAPA